MTIRSRSRGGLNGSVRVVREVCRMIATVKSGKAVYSLIAIVIGLLAMCMAGMTYGQSALDGFDPQATSTVHAIAVQPDGKILLGGEFNQVLGVPRNGIARLNRDGTVDNTFNANAGSTVRSSIAIQADGKILVGGYFGESGSIGGQTRGNMARLGSQPEPRIRSTPVPIYTPLVVVIQPDGKILIGGIFYDHWWASA